MVTSLQNQVEKAQIIPIPQRPAECLQDEDVRDNHLKALRDYLRNAERSILTHQGIIKGYPTRLKMVNEALTLAKTAHADVVTSFAFAQGKIDALTTHRDRVAAEIEDISSTPISHITKTHKKLDDIMAQIAELKAEAKRLKG